MRKEVVTEQRTITVPVSREEVVIERKPASQRRATSSKFEKEEIRVGKRRIQDTKQVSAAVRKERVHVEPAGNVNLKTETRHRRDRG